MDAAAVRALSRPRARAACAMHPLFAVLLALPALFGTSVRADSRSAACPASLTREFDALFALEAGPALRSGATVRLGCDAATARVRVERAGRAEERRVARDTPDAARWLALAAAELLRTTGRAPGPRAAEPGGRAHEAGTWLRAGLCTSYGDEPRTLRLGGVLALDVRLSQNLTFSGGLALTAADRELTDVVSVRVASLSTSLALLYLVRHGRLRYGPGVGVRAGATRLAARGPEEQLELHRLWRGFAGPLAGLRAAFSVHPRVALELDLESAYVLPSIEGRDGDGAALYRQTSWSVAASLGVAVAL